MIFTALPVTVGDAFLLRSPLGTILVDAGKNRKHILQLLEKEGLPKNHINLLVCTHYDADHIQGLLGILESNKFTFDEIWLPEVLGSLSYTISEDLWAILKALRDLKPEGAETLKKEAEASPKPKGEPVATEDSPIKIANLEAVKTISALAMYSERIFWLFGPWDPTTLPHSQCPRCLQT